MKGAVLNHTLQQAEACLRAGRPRPAAERYRRVLKWLPRHPVANVRLGNLLLQSGQAEEALPLLERARQTQPKVMAHWVRLLAALQQSGHVQRARDLLQQASTNHIPLKMLECLSKSLSEPPGERQQTLLQIYRRGEPMTTEIAARLFLEDYPDHPLGWQMLGAVLQDAGKLEEALEIKQHTVEQFPNDANAHNNLALALLALGKYAAALVSTRQALAIDPALAAARQHEAQALRELARQ